MIQSITKPIFNSVKFQKLTEEVPSKEKPFTVSGISGSLWSLAAVHLFNEFQKKIILVFPEADIAEKVRDDISTLIGSENVIISLHKQKSGAESFDMTGELTQIEALNKLSLNKPIILVTHIASIATKVPAPSELKANLILITRGMEIEYAKFIEELASRNFTRKNFVETYGDFAVRGGIVDVFPFMGEYPFRIEFWGDIIESIREFEVISQRSIKEVEELSILPKLESSICTKTFFDYLNNESIIFYEDSIKLTAELEELKSEGVPTELTIDEVLNYFQNYSRIEHKVLENQNVNINFSTSPQPTTQGSIKTLHHFINELISKEIKIFIFSETKIETDRLKELLSTEELSEKEETQIQKKDFLSEINFATHNLHDGFIYYDAKIAIFTEHQIFGRIRHRNLPKRKRFKGISQKELQQLKTGDFIVHIDYGIGKFIGLKFISINSKQQEVVKLEYADKGVLFVNVNFINRIQKYSSAEGHTPTLNSIGGKEWDRAKQRAKKKIKDIARDLIKLYAKRKDSEGLQALPDTSWQKEMEASFMYEDTPDQAAATLVVKQDMESQFPMERLICGDVGFGKTEVAVRAAFKCVMSGRQVAILAPTTILAQQHGNTFNDRLGRYSTKIEVISRFKTSKEIKKALENISTGEADIVIGTHRILSNDVKFKELGLLIIDEEQRFGVQAKEKLRTLKTAVDTLTLTATPIPRTLQFSLMGSRDLSIISTPPRNRFPIHTEIAQFNKTIIREAIIREIHRGGQIYLVHDRIHTIEQVVSMVKEFVPEATFGIAHGQMNAHKLEKVMMEFLEKKFNVLVSTKIIESGIDIPSVNTIIINRADRFGMAELYQLRGRVGRSNIQAYAYLLVPPFSTLSKETLRRLQAVEEFTELGSGFNLAMRDLEIRGAGNLLGAEQSGFIAEMGFEMYQRLVNEAVEEIKREEFEDTFLEKKNSEIEAVIEIDVDAFIPEEFVFDNTERLDLYRRIGRAKLLKEVDEIKIELNDRFGEVPSEANNILDVERMRILVSSCMLQKLKISGNNIYFYFPQEGGESLSNNFQLDKFLKVISELSVKLFFKNEKNKTLLYGTIKSTNEEDRTDKVILLLKEMNEKLNANTEV